MSVLLRSGIGLVSASNPILSFRVLTLRRMNQQILDARRKFVLRCVAVFFVFALTTGYARGAEQVTTCVLQGEAEKFLNAVVEVHATIIANGGHFTLIHDHQCKFLFAFGDDYQTFGSRFPVRRDAQWKSMRQILGKTECANNVRLVKAKFRGTVIRSPATGTIPPDEMRLELVIQSVSDVEPVPIKCTPRTGF
jgi:hypothetical protein